MSEPPSALRRLVANALIAIGVLWMAASGLCSASFVIWMLTEDPHVEEILGILPTVLIVGGISMGIGYLVHLAGQAVRPRT